MRGRIGDLEERVVSFLLDHPGSGPREIADALGEPLQRVRAALSRLRDSGFVARGEEGRYYAVVPAVRGVPRREPRRLPGPGAVGGLGAVLGELEELKRRVRVLEERLKRLEEECRAMRGRG